MSIRKIISIHAPPRGATIVSAFSHSCLSFQFTPLREGRHHQRVRRCGGNDFNSRPSARGDGICENKKLSPKQFQFTPLREGRRGVKCIVCSQQISIHAPPRGATFQFTDSPFVKIISIHAPPRGATLWHRNAAGNYQRFQFTPLREGRLLVDGAVNERIYISIHAPPRGATLTIDDISTASIFQFTPLREGRPCELSQHLTYDFISIHAPPRGATRDFYHIGLMGEISIHAPPRGATGIPVTSGGNYTISIHAPPRGATAVPVRFGARHTDFNSRPSARGDGFHRTRHVATIVISIHAPPRGATNNRRPSTPKSDISIHAPPRGATRLVGACNIATLISIHAPPRGATSNSAPDFFMC